jgi:protein-S-isoprenylcysteine O-methyltransferase Ste14
MMHDWIGNTRGEWYVVAQGALTLLVLLAPRIDGTSPFPGAGWPLVGIVIAAAGLVLVLLGSLSLGRSLSPFPRPNRNARLVESGVFALVRHPIYTGFCLLGLGWSALWMSLAALAATVALFLLLDVKSRREERWLEERFADYARYRARVSKLVPFIY